MDEVLVISGIIKAEISVISRAEGRGRDVLFDEKCFLTRPILIRISISLLITVWKVSDLSHAPSSKAHATKQKFS